MSSDNLLKKLKSKRYRDAFVASHISNTVALQIRSLRARFGWDQSTLGEKAGGMKQTAISRLENPDYGNLSVNTLKRLASAFDVALIVRFAPFSEVVNWEQGLSQEALTPPDFSYDFALQVQTVFIDAGVFANCNSAVSINELAGSYNLTSGGGGFRTIYDYDFIAMGNRPRIGPNVPQPDVVFTNLTGARVGNIIPTIVPGARPELAN